MYPALVMMFVAMADPTNFSAFSEMAMPKVLLIFTYSAHTSPVWAKAASRPPAPGMTSAAAPSTAAEMANVFTVSLIDSIFVPLRKSPVVSFRLLKATNNILLVELFMSLFLKRLLIIIGGRNTGRTSNSCQPGGGMMGTLGCC